MAIISQTVESLKSSVAEAFSASIIQRACVQAGHRWRVRSLDPVTTIWLFALQILHCNTACSHVARLLPDRQVSDSAYCQARSRLPLVVFQKVFGQLVRSLRPSARSGRCQGRRVLIADGTSCVMPDTEALGAAFGHHPNQAPGCGFPTMSLLALFEAGSGLLIDFVTEQWRRHDASLLQFVLRRMRRGDVLVADRAFGGYCQLALLLSRGVDAVTRLHQRRKVGLRQGSIDGLQDQIKCWTKPHTKPKWMDQATYDRLPEQMTVRVLEYRVQSPGSRTQKVRLATTLLDPSRYPAQELASLYLDRWEIETNFCHLKRTLGMDALKCRTVDGVSKEVHMFAMVYNLVRVTMLEAADRQGVPPDRISFIDVLRWLTDRSPGEPLPTFKVNPARPGRHRPRVVKRRPSNYTYMQPGHLAKIRRATGA